ncbi:uncharacterized protein FMAN_01857 [Fusarium mangiferae]|uniref:Uncharacterized protein n=1 Tax=Fusarium mangiferae TaxID=192010 RepID=A0A1L7SKJ2_FUSMA|nr:uncharacterized protein FMAN_01857 [Fusarium mangiferae]CVK84933.1 uncharacterized protein FMAN_01857 [Fusarium mangiferae]
MPQISRVQASSTVHDANDASCGSFGIRSFPRYKSATYGCGENMSSPSRVRTT